MQLQTVLIFYAVSFLLKWLKEIDQQSKLIPLWPEEDVRYWCGVEREERYWEIRVNPYLTGDKVTRTDEHGPKIHRFTDGQTG